MVSISQSSTESGPQQHQQRSPPLPVLDLRDLHDPTHHKDFIKQLAAVARDVGFFYLSGHGVAQEQLTKLEEITERFFLLPQEQKDKIRMANSPHFRGYTPPDSEITRKASDHREQLDIGAELPALLPWNKETDPIWRRMQGPNQFPDEALPELRNITLDWSNTLRSLAIQLLEAFAEALEHPTDALSALYSGTPAQLLKLLRYPGSAEAHQQQGVGAHKDSDILTVLHQDSVGGLQVEVEDGKWIDATPIPGTFVINIGEVLELATNGYLRATVHRVVTPPAGVIRRSIAYFIGPSLDGSLPLLKLPPNLAALAKGPDTDPDNPLFRDLGFNSIKGRLRSHLDVTERHYPDQYAEILAAKSSTKYLK